jgi:hypothetical protein
MRNYGLLFGASVLLVTTLSSAQASAQVEEIARQLGLGTRLSDTKISSGLKQALQMGAEQAVKLTGRPNGYFSNPAIKILMPNNLRPVEKGLRMMGYGPKIDDFVLSMNRAAEAAAPAARKIFIDAITAMTINDARGILSVATPPLPITSRPEPRRNSRPRLGRWWSGAWLRTVSSGNTTRSRSNINRFHSPKIRIWTSATT